MSTWTVTTTVVTVSDACRQNTITSRTFTADVENEVLYMYFVNQITFYGTSNNVTNMYL